MEWIIVASGVEERMMIWEETGDVSGKADLSGGCPVYFICRVVRQPCMYGHAVVVGMRCGRYMYVDSLGAFRAAPEHSSSPFSSHGDDVVGGRT